MILAIIFGCLALGWTVNAAVFQARGRVWASLLNMLLAGVAMGLLVWRLS